MIVELPIETPVTIPDEATMVATAGLLLVHVPPETGLTNVVLPPTHTVADPVIGKSGLTVSVVRAKHPPGEV